MWHWILIRLWVSWARPALSHLFPMGSGLLKESNLWFPFNFIRITCIFVLPFPLIFLLPGMFLPTSIWREFGKPSSDAIYFQKVDIEPMSEMYSVFWMQVSLRPSLLLRCALSYTSSRQPSCSRGVQWP